MYTNNKKNQSGWRVIYAWWPEIMLWIYGPPFSSGSNYYITCYLGSISVEERLRCCLGNRLYSNIDSVIISSQYVKFWVQKQKLHTCKKKRKKFKCSSLPHTSLERHCVIKHRKIVKTMVDTRTKMEKRHPAMISPSRILRQLGLHMSGGK